MKRTKKRALSILLSMVMVIALFAVMPMSALAGPYHEAGTAGELATALDNVDDGGIIRLTASFDYPNSIILNSTVNKSFIIDLNGHILDVTHSGGGSAIDITGSYKLTITDGSTNKTGVLNVTATTGNNHGMFIESGELINDGAIINAKATGEGGASVNVSFGGKATVSSAAATGEGGVGVYAVGDGSSITVTGNVTARDIAVIAEDGGTVNVTGNVKSTELFYETAVECKYGIITIGGNVTAGGSSVHGAVGCLANSKITIKGDVVSGDVGVFAGGDGEVTIDGKITVPSSGVYIKLNDKDKTQADFTTPTTKAGYVTYSETVDQLTTSVWVKVITSPPLQGDTPPTAGSNVPQTGENTILWWTALLISSLLFLAVLSIMYFRKRHF